MIIKKYDYDNLLELLANYIIIKNSDEISYKKIIDKSYFIIDQLDNIFDIANIEISNNEFYHTSIEFIIANMANTLIIYFDDEYDLEIETSYDDEKYIKNAYVFLRYKLLDFLKDYR